MCWRRNVGAAMLGGVMFWCGSVMGMLRFFGGNVTQLFWENFNRINGLERKNFVMLYVIVFYYYIYEAYLEYNVV